jgi:hypothetical protein
MGWWIAWLDDSWRKQSRVEWGACAGEFEVKGRGLGRDVIVDEDGEEVKEAGTRKEEQRPMRMEMGIRMFIVNTNT